MNTIAIDQDNAGTENPRTHPLGSTAHPEVAAYLGLVRLALADLPTEDVEDLTGGLEADLAELAAESDQPLLTRLGEPSAYAAELRAAAGLPPAMPVAPAELGRRTLRDQAAGLGQWWRQQYVRHPWLVQLRPLWWLLRGGRGLGNGRGYVRVPVLAHRARSRRRIDLVRPEDTLLA